MVTFSDVLITVIFLLALTFPGILFAKLKLLPEKAGEVLSVIVLYCCQPVLNVVCFQGCTFNAHIGINMLWVAAIATAIHLLLFFILKLAFYKKKADEKIGIIKYSSVFSNCGFMGIPFLQSLFTDSAIQAEILVYCAVVIAVFNVLNWTVGVYLITGDEKEISPKKVVLNPVVISVFIGLVLFLIFQKPIVELAAEGSVGSKALYKLMDSLRFISNMITPLSMFMIGIKIANMDFKYLFNNVYSLVAAAVKLIVMPMLTIISVAFLPISTAAKYTLFFLFAMPCASSGAMMAVKYQKDGQFASALVLVSTILCSITIPITYLLATSLFAL